MRGPHDLHRRVSTRREDGIKAVLFIAASAAIIISGAIVYTLLEGSASFFLNPKSSVSEFLFGIKWVPSGSHPSFGIWPLLSGTLLIAGGALLIGTPLGIASALYLSEFASHRVKLFAKPVIEILAGIPSVVYGFFALMVISPLLREHLGASYFNAASAIIVLAVMVLPLIVSISDDSLRAVPKDLRNASLALGATKWETSVKVVIPAASSGIMASVLLALGRAIGETMVVTMAAGSVARLTLNPFEEVQTMTAYIAQVATGDIPPGIAVDAAFAVGLAIFAITYGVNIIAGKITRSIRDAGMEDLSHSKTAKAVSFIWSAALRIKSLTPSSGKPTLASRRRDGRIGVLASSTSLIITVVFLSLLVASVLDTGIGSISSKFISSYPSYKPEKAGIYPVILGSVYLVLLTLLFTVPIGVGAAVYLTEFAPHGRYTDFLRRIIQNLAGVPSIVFGLVGLAVFVRLFGMGTSLLSGSLTLSIMVLPIIVVATEEALKSVPESFRLAATGLGATKWQGIRDHVIPNALPGILTGCILALSRAIGETAPILFIGSTFSKVAPQTPLDSFMALPLTIFYWTRHPKTEFHELAAATIIVMLFILLALNSLAIVIRESTYRRRQW